MKVSIDGILNSAQKINNQRQEKNSDNKGSKEVKGDTLSIGKRVDSRIDSIDREFRTLQSSLTKNQIIKDGIAQLREDNANGGQNTAAIMENVKYDKKNVLQEFVGNSSNEEVLQSKEKGIYELITVDINKLKELQVELDNIMASNLASDKKLDTVLKDMDSFFNSADVKNVNSFSQLNAENVLRLVK